MKKKRKSKKQRTRILLLCVCLLMTAVMSLSMMLGMSINVEAGSRYVVEDLKEGSYINYSASEFASGNPVYCSLRRPGTAYVFVDFESHKISILKSDNDPYGCNYISSGSHSPARGTGYKGKITNPEYYQGMIFPVLLIQAGEDLGNYDWLFGDYEIEKNEFYVDPDDDDDGDDDDNDTSSEHHEHDFQWKTISPVTTSSYGTEGYVCSKCGATKDVITKAPYEQAGLLIDNAETGDTVILDFGPWHSYPKWMLEKIAAKPDVTFVFKYTYKNEKYEVIIEPGTQIPLDCLWYGPKKMAALFGANITN